MMIYIFDSCISKNLLVSLNINLIISKNCGIDEIDKTNIKIFHKGNKDEAMKILELCNAELVIDKIIQEYFIEEKKIIKTFDNLKYQNLLQICDKEIADKIIDEYFTVKTEKIEKVKKYFITNDRIIGKIKIN